MRAGLCVGSLCVGSLCFGGVCVWGMFAVGCQADNPNGTSLLSSGTSDQDISMMSVVQARRLWLRQRENPSPAGAVFIDCRGKEFFAQGHIPGARHMLISEVVWRKLVPALEASDAIIVYGDNPGSPAARGMVKRMQAYGYDDVYLLDGGLEAWRVNGGELAQ
jgi:3-mercaptopyruvate sulfurtransferase SseA